MLERPLSPRRRPALITFGWAARRWDALPAYVRSFVQLVNDGFRDLEPEAHAEVLC